jgi:amino-acid N-acetyltransferase
MRSVIEPAQLDDKPVRAGDVEVRKAGMRDIHALLTLINAYAAKGIMLPRTEFEMSENIRDFSVVYGGDRLLGCGALHFYTPTTAEVRSLAVDPELKTRGIGRILIESLEAEAVADGLHAIFAFTYVPQFFRRLGFEEVERGELPLKAWKDCLRCPKFQCCDEIPVLKALVPNPVLAPGPDRSGFLVQLPQVISASRNRK